MRRVLCGALLGGFGLAAAAACVGSDPATVTSSLPDAGPVPVSDGATPVPEAEGGAIEEPDASPMVGGGPCDPMAPFVAFRSLGTIVNDGDEQFAARLTDDELTIYITKSSSAPHVKRYTRPALDAPWTVETDPFAGANYYTAELWPSLDAGHFYAAQAQPASPGVTLGFDWRIIRGPIPEAGGYKSFATIPRIADPNHQYVQPFLPHDETELYYVAVQGTGGRGSEILRAASDGDGGFLDPAPIGVNTTSDEGNPVISADALTLYYSSNSGRKVGNAIWMATRPDRTSDWTAPQDAPGLQPLQDEAKKFAASPDWISSDNCRLYLSTTFDGNLDIYIAWRH